MGFLKYRFTFDPRKKGLKKILGELESEIMEIIWSRGQATVRDVFNILCQKRDIAYTTVKTVMERLSAKRLLNQSKQSNAFVYIPSLSKESFTRSTIKEVLAGLLEDFYEPVTTQFVDSMDEVEEEKIEELAALIEKKRRKKN